MADPSAEQEPRTWQEAAVRNRLLISAVQADYKLFTRRVWTGIVILAIVAVITFWQVLRLIGDNSQRVNDIQGQRLTLCLDQNARHDQTVNKLNAVISQLPNSRERAQAEANKKFTIELIDQLAPKVKCSAVIKPLPKEGR